MVCSILLLGFLAVAAYTDWRWHLIYNKTTYPGMLVALSASALVTLLELPDAGGAGWSSWLGFVGFPQSILGLLANGLLVLACYVCMPGQVGGGDVKLMAMIGAFLGLYPGLETLLWTFVIAACLAVIRLIWSVGAGRLFVRTARILWGLIRTGTLLELQPEDRRQLRTPLHLSTSALLAVLVVRFQLIAPMNEM